MKMNYINFIPRTTTVRQKVLRKYLGEVLAQKRLVIGDRIGYGTNGYIHKLVNVDDKVIKVIKLEDKFDKLFFDHEVQAMHELQCTGITPRIYDSWICRRHKLKMKKGYIIMELLHKYKTKPSRNEVKQLLDKAEQHGWLHVDTHDENVMCDASGNLKLIDWGTAWKPEWGDAVGWEHVLATHHPKKRSVEYLRKFQQKRLERNFT